LRVPFSNLHDLAETALADDGSQFEIIDGK
jgi:hypothetical protein